MNGKFEKGNKFWNNRSKHGRDTLFANPGMLWDAACEYFEWVDENPFIEIKPMTVSIMGGGSRIELVEIPIKRPFTHIALCSHLNCSFSYFRNFKYESKEQKEKRAEFLAVIEQIEETIFNQKFEGAAAGFFNAAIIASDLGLKNNTDLTSGGEKINVSNTIITELSDQTLREIADKLSKDK